MGWPLVVAAQADMGVCQLPEVERPILLVMEPLVQKPVHPLGGGIAKPHAQVIVERLQVPGLETFENHLVPDDERLEQIELLPRCTAIEQLIIIDDMKPLR